MPIVQIKNRWTDAVLFECDAPDGTESGMLTRHAVEKAVEARANLTDANLTGANLTDANLTGANLAGAYLAGANLAGAYLAGANLTGAYLTGASLTGASLADASLTGAKWRNGIVINKPPIQLYGLHWNVTILDEHMQIGCELHTLADWTSFDDKRICSMDRNALRFWRENKDALLALAKANGRGVATEAEAAV